MGNNRLGNNLLGNNWLGNNLLGDHRLLNYLRLLVNDLSFDWVVLNSLLVSVNGDVL